MWLILLLCRGASMTKSCLPRDATRFCILPRSICLTLSRLISSVSLREFFLEIFLFSFLFFSSRCWLLAAVPRFFVFCVSCGGSFALFRYSQLRSSQWPPVTSTPTANRSGIMRLPMTQTPTPPWGMTARRRRRRLQMPLVRSRRSSGMPWPTC